MKPSIEWKLKRENTLWKIIYTCFVCICIVVEIPKTKYRENRCILISNLIQLLIQSVNSRKYEWRSKNYLKQIDWPQEYTWATLTFGEGFTKYWYHVRQPCIKYVYKMPILFWSICTCIVCIFYEVFPQNPLYNECFRTCLHCILYYMFKFRKHLFVYFLDIKQLSDTYTTVRLIWIYISNYSNMSVIQKHIFVHFLRQNCMTYLYIITYLYYRHQIHNTCCSTTHKIKYYVERYTVLGNTTIRK